MVYLNEIANLLNDGTYLQMLKVISLEVPRDVVYLQGGQQRGEREDGGVVAHRAVVIERALRVHQHHSHLYIARHELLHQSHLGGPFGQAQQYSYKSFMSSLHL